MILLRSVRANLTEAPTTSHQIDELRRYLETDLRDRRSRASERLWHLGFIALAAACRPGQFGVPPPGHDDRRIMSEEHSSVLTKKSDVGNKVRSGSGGAKSDGPVAIALKYSLKIGKEATDNIKVGTWLESPTNLSAMVVDIHNDFQKLNDALGKAQFEFKQVKRGYEGDLADKALRPRQGGGRARRPQGGQHDC